MYYFLHLQENAALLDEIEEVQVQVIMRKEERKFLLRKLCQYEPQTEAEVQALARVGMGQSNATSTENNKKIRKRHSDTNGKQTLTGLLNFQF